LDLPSLRQRERRWSTTRILRRQRIEPVVVEVVDHRPDPILRRERDLRDRRHVHPLRRPQHDLGPPPPHHRPRPAPHDRQQLAALIIRQITHPRPPPPPANDNSLRPPQFVRPPTGPPPAIPQVCATPITKWWTRPPERCR